MDVIKLTVTIFFCITYSHGFDRHLAIQNVFPVIKTGASTYLLCHNSDNNPSEYYFERLETGQGQNLPPYSHVTRFGDPTNTLGLHMEADSGQSRFGIYACQPNSTASEPDNAVIAFKLPDPTTADVSSSRPFITKNSGEKVTFQVNTTGRNLPLIWFHNQKEIPDWTNETKVTIQAVNTTDAGIYECFYEGRRSEGVHALIQLLVRECPAEKWGPNCQEDCPACYNGGICHGQLGVCICAVGFDGDNCEIACEKNRFGKDCKKQCDYESADDQEEACAAYVFCLPPPLGCSCASGFFGPVCRDNCTDGTYGADCLQTCHCQNGESCDKITGECTSECMEGWTGNSCEIPIANNTFQCPDGHFGFPDCDFSCHCYNDTQCNFTTGECPLDCKDGWAGENCSMCTPGVFGSDCNMTCHCINGNDSCDSITGYCEGGCSAGFTGQDCQDSCTEGTYGPNCLLNCTCDNGGSCDSINGICSCTDQWKGLSCNESEPTIISIEPLDINVGATVNLTCNVTSTNPITDSNIWSNDLPDTLTSVDEINGTEYTITISAQFNSTGNYTVNCSVSNIHGTDNTQYVIEVVDPPVLLSAPILRNLTFNTMELEWKQWSYGTDIGGKIDDNMEIEYNVVVKTDNSDWFLVGNWHNTLGTRIGGLHPDTVYEVAIQCRRHGIDGEGAYSPSIVIHTACIVPKLSETFPKGLKLHEVQTNNITIKWKNLHFGLISCNDTQYEVIVTSDDTLYPGNSTVLAQEMKNFTIDNLESNNTYNIEVRLIVAGNTIGIPAVMNITTSSIYVDPVNVTSIDNETEAVEDLEAKPASPTTCYLTWKKSSSAVEPEKYQITITLLSIEGCTNTNNTEFVVETNKYELMLTKLQPNSIYEVRVESNLTDISEASITQFKTDEDVPTAQPINLRHTDISMNETRFDWDDIPCDSMNGNFLHFEYTINNKSGPYNTTSDNHLVLQTDQFGSSYTIFIRVVNQVGAGPDAKLEITRVQPTAPLTNFEITSLSPTNVQLSWQSSSKTTTQSNYLVTVQLLQIIGCEQASEKPIEIAVQQEEVNITNLHPHALYSAFITWNGSVLTNNFTTPKSVPLGIPTNVKTKHLSTTQLQFDWDEPPCDLINGDFLRFEYKLTSPEKSNNTDLYNSTTEKSFVFPVDITENYIFQLRIVTDFGIGPSTQLEINKTKEVDTETTTVTETTEETTELFPPRDLEVIRKSTTSLEIKWIEPISSNRLVTGYHIQYHILSSQSLKNESSSGNYNTTTEEKFVIIDSLSPSSEYEVEIFAIYNTSESVPLKGQFRTLNELDIDQITTTLPPPPSPLTYTNLKGFIIVIVYPIPKTDKVRAYQVIVSDEDNNDVFENAWLKDFQTATEEGFHYYITAEINSTDVFKFGYNLTAGDGLIYNGFYNAPLQISKEYKFHVRAIGWDKTVSPVVSSVTNDIQVILPEPPSPTLYATNDGLIGLIIYPIQNNEKIRGYQILVENEDNNENLEYSWMENFELAAAHRIPYYITAEIKAEDVDKYGYNLTIGDDLEYNGYHNVPLESEKEYRLHVRAIGWDRTVSPLVQCSHDSDVKVGARKVASASDSCEIMSLSCPLFLGIIAGIIILCLLLLIISVIIVRKQKSMGIHEIQQSDECLDQPKRRSLRKSRTYSGSYTMSYES